jgi:hypothetical protein
VSLMPVFLSHHIYNYYYIDSIMYSGKLLSLVDLHHFRQWIQGGKN